MANMRSIARTLSIFALWSFSTASNAAGNQALLLADGLMDKEAVCAVYMHRQREAIRSLASVWRTDRKEEAGNALFAGVAPVMSEICDKSWRRARDELAEIVEAELSASSRATVYKFLSSTAGTKFLSGARAGAINRISGSNSETQPNLSPQEKMLWMETHASEAWSKYKSLGSRGSALFSKAHAQEGRPYVPEIESQMQLVRERFDR
jgi:hypothetical protein